MKRILPLIISLLFAIHVFGQKASGNEGVRYLFTQANLMVHEHYYDSALHTFLIINKQEPDNANICYYIGQLYLETPAHKADALPYLTKAASHVATRYHPDDPYEKNAPGPAYYFFGRALHLNYEFSDAIVNLDIFKKLLAKNDERQKDIDYWVNCCNSGIELMKSPVDCKITDMGDSINGPYPDYSPVITADEQEIIFTSRRLGGMNDSTTEKDSNGFYNEDIYISYAKPDGGWTKAKTLSNIINTVGNDASTYISPDGEQLIFYRDNTKGSASLNVSYLRGSQWSYTQSIDSSSPGTVNSTSLTPFASLSPDQKTLFFSSKRAGGLGGLDLYKISISDSGKWSAPVNLGPDINTEYDEDAPFMHPDNSTLFFSSKGHNTMGGYDVFMATQDSGNHWSNVKNMGYPVNTPDDDINFSCSADGRRAYYSTVRKDGYGEKDIYAIIFNNPLPVNRVAVLVGYIHTPDNSPIPGDIQVKTSLVKGNSVFNTKVNPQTGKFLQVLRPNQTYNVVINSQGKDVFNQNFYLPMDSSYFTLSRAFFRTGIVLGDTSNVFVPKPKIPVTNMTGQVLLNDVPVKPLANMKIQLVDAKGRVIQTTLTDNDGHFTFEKLPIDQSYLVEVDVTDPKLKHLKKLLLVNARVKVVRNFDESKEDSYFYHDLPADLNNLSEISRITAIPPKPIRIAAVDADYVEYFKYNADQASDKASSFAALISKTATKLLKDTVTISIESSASKVPTTAQFAHSNQVLAEKRGADAQKTILAALKKRLAKVKKLKFEMKAQVQGPDYEQDAQDQDKYQKFQYVKVFMH